MRPYTTRSTGRSTGSRPGRPRVALMAAATTSLSAVLLYLGTGLHPVAWLTWLAPLPVLLLAPRVPASLAALTALLAWGAGGLTTWTLQRDRMGLPLPVALLNLLVPALLAVVAVLLFRTLLRRDRPCLAAVSVPATWVSAEYLVPVLTPNGAIWSLAPTQSDLLPVLQLASLTGGWGVTFLVTGLPAALAASRRGRPRIAAAALVLVALVAGLGALRLGLAHPDGPVRTIALLASRQQGDWAPADTPRGRERLAEVLARLRALSPGTDMAILPEGGFVTTSDDLPLITRPLAALARDRRLDIVAGVIVTDANRNTAMVFPAAGGEPGTYLKRHMVPGVESYTPGDRLLLLPGAGVAICKDLDFPSLAREYRRRGAELMLLPAWDFDLDDRQHARTAVLRGVENGFWIARSAANGNLTVSDPYGRVLAETTTTSRAVVTLTATVRTGGTGAFATYGGDWFAWLCLALTALSLVTTRRPSARNGRVPEPLEGRRTRRVNRPPSSIRVGALQAHLREAIRLLNERRHGTMDDRRTVSGSGGEVPKTP
ncbi:nitrilase-related carbon-nitrogen hydrolase [Streptosporangium sp. NPDC023615]|uniref:nitrilase-related carbon-nitrogen hydrolase n=1 Tax=Streptosporangium sp. NPDC023615 TaxID=3154794 RepID=UPI00342A083B